ncbi:MAG: MFS transporter, partial [Nitrospirae bacterium]|nr:MFS transporter [Nitrospirota bacterium]
MSDRFCFPWDALQARLPAFKHRNYRLFFGGQLFSLIGTWMQSVAQAWLVYRLTGSPVLLGLVAFANQVPVLFLSPLTGTLADRTSRYRIFLGTQVCAMALAFTLAGLTLTERVDLWHILALAALLGVVNAFDLPARQAFVVEMVGREDLGNAIALNSSLFNGARVAGPVLAGVFVATIGEGWCFFVNGISYLPLIAALLGMRVAPRARGGRNGSPWRDLVDGFRFVAKTGPVRALLLLLGLASLTAIPYVVLMPIFADQILGSGPRGLGILMAASGVGAVAGALSLVARRKTEGLEVGVAVAAAGFGAALIVFALSRSFWVSVAF